MTNYDRWKLATPDYLEDTDGEDDDQGSYAESELELQRYDEFDSAYATKGAGQRS